MGSVKATALGSSVSKLLCRFRTENSEIAHLRILRKWESNERNWAKCICFDSTVGTLDEAFSILADDPALNAAVLDINLNGQLVYPVANQLRTRGIPYLFCTGYDGLEPDKRHGEHPIMQKPTNLRLLIESVRMLCCDIPPGPGNRRAA